MREDFDFVTIENYQHDMAEQSALAANIVTFQQRKIKDLERTVWCLVKAAGGRVEIDRGISRTLPEKMGLTWFERPDTEARVFIADVIQR